VHYAVRITFRTTHGFRRRLRLLADRYLPTDDRELNDARAPLPADAAVMSERSEALRRIITKLPAAQAEALLLHVALEYPIAEVAAINGVSVDTIKTRLKLAKDSLRRRIERDRALRSILGGKP
jgi:RNA polymerase sigma factor (sigma-70 family)